MNRLLLSAFVLVFAGGSAPPCLPAPRAIELPAAGFNAFPPCIEVQWTAHGVSGRPPLSLVWKVDGQTAATGPSWIMDTADYTGFHTVTCTVTNPWGSATASSFFVIDSLSVPALVAAQNPAPGLTVTVFTPVPMRGANEWRIAWGDGTATPFSCDFTDPTLETSHTYAAPGTYTVRLRGRNCRDPVMEGPPIQVTVGDPDAIDVTEFQVQGCQAGFCVFPSGQPLTFVQSFSAQPTQLRYDWNGDGTVDQVTTVPVTVHTYHQGGVYRPTLTAVRGANQHTRQHQDFILINQGGPAVLFRDGFETGNLTCWTAAVPGGPPSLPGPGCFPSIGD
jgi:PKD repeat protein